MPPLSERMISRAPRWARPGVELVIRTATDSLDDRLHGLAAEVAFFVVLSLPALLLTFVGAAAYLPEDVETQVQSILESAAGQVFTGDTMNSVISPMIDTLLDDARPDIYSLGFVLALWSASRALNATVQAVTIAYDLDPKRRSGVKQRLAVYGFTIVALAAGAVLMIALVVGPRLGARLAEPLGLSGAFVQAWKVAYWPVIAAVATGFITLLYHLGTPAWTPWRRDLPGAVLAVGGWALGSFALRAYANVSIRSGDEAIYGRFAAPLVLLLWVYVTAFVLLLGAELNAEIEKLWPTPGHERERDRMLARRLRRSARRVRDRLGGSRLKAVLSDRADGRQTDPGEDADDGRRAPDHGST